LGRLATLADVDATLEVRAVFNRDAGGDNVASQRAVAANVDAVAGGEVAAHFAQHNDLAGADIGRYYAIPAHRDPVAGKIDGAFDAAINIKRFGACDLALND